MSSVNSNNIRNVKYYGATGDGITDDYRAMQIAFNFVVANGGTMYIPSGKYFCTIPLVLQSNNVSFTVYGDGDSSTIISSANGQMIVAKNVDGAVFRDFKVIGVNGSKSHGVVGLDSSNILFSRITAQNFVYTGIIVYVSSHELVGKFSNVVIDSCVVDGTGIENNGLLLVDMRQSRITNCIVNNINMNGSPSYGITLKKDCQYCLISDCIVSNCKGGVILGEDGESHTGIGPQNNNITNCNILGCQFPLLFGKIKSNTFTNINIDNMNKPTSFSAIHMLDGTSSYASCSNNVFNAINIKNVINTHSIVRLGDYSHDNFISVGHYGGNYRARHCLFEPNSVNNRVRIKVMQDFNANTNWLVEDHGTRNNYKIQDIHVK